MFGQFCSVCKVGSVGNAGNDFDFGSIYVFGKFCNLGNLHRLCLFPHCMLFCNLGKFGSLYVVIFVGKFR